MRRLRNLLLSLTLFLAACGSVAGRTPAAAPGALTGTAPAMPSAARTVITYVPSEGIGNIAVSIAIPRTARYAEGAGVVVVVSPFFTTPAGFQTDLDLTRLGLIYISYLWPGLSDSYAKVRSDGEFDYGGEKSIQALLDVIHFAAGLVPDKDGRYLAKLTSVTPLTDEVGLYAFSEAGIAALNVLSLDSDKMQNVKYYVGCENPTIDTISSMELGYWGLNGQPVYDPVYQYPQFYDSSKMKLDYSAVRWDPGYIDGYSASPGRPYLDRDNDGRDGTGDFVFSGPVPVMFGKRYYSTALTQALLDNGALTLADWPASLATPQEAAQAWQFRESADRYQNLRDSDITSDLKVMLVFAKDDHAQVAPDKPHIHQAFQGFRFESRLWVRLNPDRAYVQSMLPNAGPEFPDNPANTQPQDWTHIGDWAYPGGDTVAGLVSLAAVAEMADRTYAGDWDDNLGQVLSLPPGP